MFYRFLGGLSLMLSLCHCTIRPITSEIPEKGVSSELAAFRKKQLAEVHYTLSFDIPEVRKAPIKAELFLDANIRDNSRPLYLDFKADPASLLKLEVNGKEIPIHYEKEHLIIPVAELEVGRNAFHIQFIAGALSLNRNEDFLYTLLVPDRARTLFPCFDQPDIKAGFRLKIIAPASWNVMSGAPLVNAKRIGKQTAYQFGTSDVISTYLFSFVAGNFKTATDTLALRPMKLFYRETNQEKIRKSVDTIFKLHAHALEFLEKYTAQPFPFQKLDFAALPEFQYGGMEHVGAIQYNEAHLFLDSSATKSQELGRAKLIAHETAHMWFGDLVTMKWFNDVWLKEVFANVMANKIINPAFPEVNHELQFVLDHHPSAYSVDRTRGSNPIRQELKNLADAGSLYGNIIYHKAPIMMHQLEIILGAVAFQKGLQVYLQKYAYGNADWSQLVTIFNKATLLDIQEWNQTWVHSTGRPVLSGTIQYNSESRIDSLIITQTAEDGTAKVWPQIFDIGLVYPDTVVSMPVHLYQKTATVTAANGLTKPDAVIYNNNGYGYGVFPLPENMNTVIPELEDEIARGYSYINSFENTLNGNITTEAALELFGKGLRSESNELILRYLTNATGQLYWMYLGDEDKPRYQEALQQMLFERMNSNASPNIKKTLYGLFRSIAYSDLGREQLYRIWKKALVIPGLQLNEEDYTALAMQLAVYAHPQTPAILETARKALENPDKIRRFDFLQPALSQDKKVRKAFFESFRQEANREKESWVLAACYYIHHPLRQEAATACLPMSLEILPEIAATGDIFFPKAWLDNTIGLYRTDEAYAILQDYLARASDLNPFLKAKLLQATDDLYRVHQMKKGPQGPE